MRAKGYDKTPDVKLEVPIGKYIYCVCRGVVDLTDCPQTEKIMPQV